MMMGPDISEKLLIKPSLAIPLAACTTLVFRPAVFQVITKSDPVRLNSVTWNTDAGFVGFNPARNWFQLLMPLPRGSASGAALGHVVQPKYCNCHTANAVNGTPLLIRLLEVSATNRVPEASTATPDGRQS